MSDPTETKCVRVRTTVAGEEKCYVLIGDGFCEVKFPDENKKELQEVRRILDSVCQAVVIGMERLK
jgi:hypothetical protein